jgi:hypothetical protein
MVDINPNITKEQIKEALLELIKEGTIPYKEVLKEIINERRLFFSYDNLPKQAEPYSISKQKFEALQKVFSDEYSEE